MRKLVALLVVLAACGDDGVHHLPDGPTFHDAGIDGAPGIDAAILPVTITVTASGAPVAAVKVYFQAPDSTEISSTTTDANGSASALMPIGGFVTAIDPFPAVAFIGNHTIKTFANVKPGDHLVLTQPLGVTPTAITVTINGPADPANPYDYYIFNSCDQGETAVYTGAGSGTPIAPSTTATLYGCGATADFLVITTDISSVPLDAFTMTGVPVSDGATIDLTGGTYAAVPLTTFNVSNVPDVFFNPDYYVTLLAPDGISTGPNTLNAYATVTAGAGAAHIGIPTVTGASLVEHLDLGYTSYGTHNLYRWGATPATDGSYSFDVSGRALLDFASRPTYDQPTNAISWTTNPGTAPDLYATEFEIDRSEPDGSGGFVTSFFDWTIAGAFSGASIVPPTLPGDAAVYNAIAADLVNVSHVDLAKLPGGYDTVRAHIIDLYDQDSYFESATFVGGTSGHFEVEYSSQPGFTGRLAHAKHRAHARHR